MDPSNMFTSVLFVCLCSGLPRSNGAQNQNITERDTLKQHMEELRPSTSSSSSVTSSATPSFQEEGLRGMGDAAAERLVNEERFKWQVEVVNVRRELKEKGDRERRGWKEKGEELKAELAKVKREVEEGRLLLQQVGA